MVDEIWYNMEELIGGSEERVLIETYWNVNQKGQDVTISSLFGINRNILECKFSTVVTYFLSFSSVLIETYWNVNFITYFKATSFSLY